MAIYSSFGYGFNASSWLPQGGALRAGFQAGLQAGLLGDGFQGSLGFNEGLSGPLGGLGGFGNPMLGLGSLGMAGPEQLAQLSQLLGGANQMCANQGCGAPGLGEPGQPPQGTVELSPGQSFTTPGGCTITWQQGKKSEVDVTEPGGNNRSLGCMGGEEEGAAAAAAGPGGASAAASGNGAAAAASAGPGGASAAAACAAGAPSGCAPSPGAAPQSWNVHGDPHIKNPNGKNSNFTTKNSMFTLQDGSKVIMCAPGAHGKVNRVQIIPPGGQPNWNGIDPSKTSIMQNQGGMFRPIGTADQMMAGGFR